MPSPFFKKVEGREGIMPALCPGEAGTPYLRKLSSLPEMWSHDFVATHELTAFPSPDLLYPL